MPINRTPLQQAVHNLGTELRRMGNTPDWSDDALCPKETGDHGVVVSTLKYPIRYSRYIGPGHPALTEAGVNAPPDHDKHIDGRPLAEWAWSAGYDIPHGLMNALLSSLRTVTNQQISEALSKTWASGLEPQFFDAKGDAPKLSALLAVLPYLPSKNARYVTPDATEPPRGNECRDYAIRMKSDLVAIGVTACAMTLDYAGHHSYNLVAADDDVFLKTNDLVVVGLEPQANVLVRQAFPEHGYTGCGRSDWY